MIVERVVTCMGIPECIRCGEDLFGESAEDSLDLTGDNFICGDCVNPHINEFVEEMREMETGEWDEDGWLQFDGVEFAGNGAAMEERISNPFVSDLTDEEVEKFSS